MTKAIIVAFHKYTPFGGEYYEPILDFFIQNAERFCDEFDTLYLLDSTWDITDEKIRKTSIPVSYKTKIVKIDPNLRYYDAYKKVLPEIEEDLVLFMDNDMVIHQRGKMKETFEILENVNLPIGRPYDVVSIYDTIGKLISPILNNKSKFCPYWFATRKELLMKYRDCEWGPVEWGETLSELTLKMISDNIKPYEWEEDKSNCLFDGKQDGDRSRRLGYYHIRSGSVPAYLLATRKYGDRQTYLDYINNQPRSEYLRQCAWYRHMGGNVDLILDDLDIAPSEWEEYMKRFKTYYGL